jgi:hypothetical protein
MDLLDPIFKLAGIDRASREIAKHNKETAEKAVGGEELYTTLLGIFGKGSADERAAVEKYLVENYGLRKENYGGKWGAEGVIGELYRQMYNTTVSGMKYADDPKMKEQGLNNLKAFLADLEPVYANSVDVVNAKNTQLATSLDGVRTASNNVAAAANHAASALNSVNAPGGSGAVVSGAVVSGAIAAVFGAHANGLDYVPYDGYFAMLHQGERVQTAAEADLSRRYGNQAPGADIGGAIRAGMGNMQIIWRGRVVADVLSEQQGDSFRALERSGWKS